MNDNMDLKNKIKNDLLSKGNKLRNKYPPISEKGNDGLLIQKVKKIFKLKEDFRNFYLIETKSTNHNKEKRYYLALIIASQSSDLLVKIAQNVIIKESDLRLIQFSFHPEHSRVSLALLKELDELSDFDELKTKLNSLRAKFLTKLNNLID
ncbi:MAG: hypothetical protein ACFFD1_03465 [Candidatus Thorarchaeota archaeon]